MSSSPCIPNIGPRQRRRRMIGGAISLTLALAVAGALLASAAPRLVRVVVFLPLLAAGLGFFQARAKTCVALAARGLANMDDGDRAVADVASLTRMRAQSRQVYAKAIAAAIVVTAVVLLI